MEDSVFEVVIRPTTWDGPEQDKYIGLFTSLLTAQDAAKEWMATHPYPFTGGGHWESMVTERPLNTVEVPSRDYSQPWVRLLDRNDRGEIIYY